MATSDQVGFGSGAKRPGVALGIGFVVMLAALAFSVPAVGGVMKSEMLKQSAFSKAEPQWQAYGPRDEIRPNCTVDAGVSRAGSDGALRIECTDPAQYGGWVRRVDGVQPENWYRFDAYYRAERVVEERRRVVARLDWQTKDGERAGQPDYVYHSEDAGNGWTHVWALAPAPPGASAVRLGLLFGWSAGGTVWWDEVSFGQSEAPGPRRVKVATIHHVPQGNKSPQENIEEFGGLIDRAAREKPDIICLPEGMTMVGTGLSYAQVAEPIPGPTSKRLGEFAKKHDCYIEACYNEREGKAVYNTAVLIDRKGELVGKYRKLYVPREEIEGGVTPGTEVPVFKTDFGTVGMMICWDVQYQEPAEYMALKGAELILLPVWGGDETLMKARAIENHVYLVSCGYDAPSWVIAPDGKVLAEAPKGVEKGAIAVATIDLNQRVTTEWLGDMKARFVTEHREDLR